MTLVSARQWTAKLFVLLAVIAVVIGCFAVAPRDAHAASPAPASMVYVNGKSGSYPSSWPAGASYNESTGTLTLNNCTGIRSIKVSSGQARDLVINLSGTSTISDSLYDSGSVVAIDN